MPDATRAKHYTRVGTHRLKRLGWNSVDLALLQIKLRKNAIPKSEVFRMITNSRSSNKTLRLPSKVRRIISQNILQRGIKYFGRYTLAMLQDNLTHKPDKKLAVTIAATEDNNGAFYDDLNYLRQIRRKGYHLKIYEASNDSQFYDAIIREGGLKRSIDLLYVSAHGDGKEADLGSDTCSPIKGNPCPQKLDFTDFASMSARKRTLVRRSFAHNARAIFGSCSGGTGGTAKLNLARFLTKSLGISALYACKGTCSNDRFVWNKNGTLNHVYWWHYGRNKRRYSSAIFTQHDKILRRFSPRMRRWIVNNVIQTTNPRFYPRSQKIYNQVIRERLEALVETMKLYRVQIDLFIPRNAASLFRSYVKRTHPSLYRQSAKLENIITTHQASLDILVNRAKMADDDARFRFFMVLYKSGDSPAKVQQAANLVATNNPLPRGLTPTQALTHARKRDEVERHIQNAKHLSLKEQQAYRWRMAERYPSEMVFAPLLTRLPLRKRKPAFKRLITLIDKDYSKGVILYFLKGFIRKMR